MKALTIKQPWLWAITDLDKRVENRTWKPPTWIVGEYIALHASKNDDPVGATAIDSICAVWPPRDLPRGEIVATARIIGWYDKSGYVAIADDVNTNKVKVDSGWFFGPVGWFLDDIQKLPDPIPCRGQLGLWDVPNDLLLELVTRPANKVLYPTPSAAPFNE